MNNVHPDDVQNMTSLWFRPMRYLFEHGSPLSKMTCLAVGTSTSDVLPFGILSHTERDRLIFWPAIPPNVKMLSDDGKKGVTDHVTLELGSKKLHVTSFDSSGDRIHNTRGWRAHQFGDSGLAYLFSFLVKWSVLESQDWKPNVRVKMPPSDKKRRTDIFANQLSKIHIQCIQLPPNTPKGDYLRSFFYLVTDCDRSTQVTSEMLQIGDVEATIDRYPASSSVPANTVAIDVDSCRVVVAITSPPGILREDLSIGFPIAEPQK